MDRTPETGEAAQTSRLDTDSDTAWVSMTDRSSRPTEDDPGVSPQPPSSRSRDAAGPSNLIRRVANPDTTRYRSNFMSDRDDSASRDELNLRTFNKVCHSISSARAVGVSADLQSTANPQDPADHRADAPDGRQRRRAAAYPCRGSSSHAGSREAASSGVWLYTFESSCSSRRCRRCRSWYRHSASAWRSPALPGQPSSSCTRFHRFTKHVRIFVGDRSSRSCTSPCTASANANDITCDGETAAVVAARTRGRCDAVVVVVGAAVTIALYLIYNHEHATVGCTISRVRCRSDAAIYRSTAIAAAVAGGAKSIGNRVRYTGTTFDTSRSHAWHSIDVAAACTTNGVRSASCSCAARPRCDSIGGPAFISHRHYTVVAQHSGR